MVSYGVFPLKGKLINAREASIKQLVNNDEFNYYNILFTQIIRPKLKSEV